MSDKPRAVRLIASARTLWCMAIGRSFIDFGLELAERALIDLMARDNLQLRPEKMPRSRRSRASGRLRQIEQIVRRLIVLMALKLHIVFAPPKGGKGKKTAELPDGVELVTFPGAADHYLVLLPPAENPLLSGPLPDSLRTICGPPGPVSTAKLLARIRAVYRVMKAPDGFARRLARTLQRVKARGEMKPIVLRSGSDFRLSAELGALSTALPGLLNASFEDAWNDSG